MKPPTREAYFERICMVLEAVLANLDAPYTHTNLGELAGYSPFHFQRAFKALTGETPADLLRRFRVERSAQRLATTANSIGSIAFEAQYESHEAFSRAFRIAFGVTAREFRGEQLRAFRIASPVGLHFDLPPRFVPLNHRQPLVEYQVKEIPPFVFAGLRHQGSFQFAHRTWGEFFSRLGEEGIDPTPYRWMNLADELSDRIPISDIQGCIGMDLPSPLLRPWMLQREVGGGRYLVASKIGDGSGLVDFWYRLFFECLPNRGLRVRPGPLFQATSGAQALGSPQSFETTVYIPVSE